MRNRFRKKTAFLGACLILSVAVAALLYVSRYSREVSLHVNDQAVSNDEAKKTILVDIFSGEEKFQNPLLLKTIRQPVFTDLVCNVADYGAIGDGVTKNTAAFEKAIKECSFKGGGQVLVPAGKWLTGPIRFKSNINLHIDKDAEIVFSTDLNDYLPVVLSRYDGVEYYNYSPLIYADKCINIAITGDGTINGRGSEFWWKNFSNISENKLFKMGATGTPLSERIFGNTQDGLRPSFIELINSKNILIENVKIVNSPRWTVHPLYSDDIIIRNIAIGTSPGRNTDGIVIDSSKNVLIEDSTVASGDDAITIKSGRDRDGLRVNKSSENIVIRNCHVLDGHGAVTIGSEVSGGIRNVFVYAINTENADFGFRIKSSVGRGGFVENVWAQDIRMRKTTKDAIQITKDYDAQFDINNSAETDIRNIFVDTLVSQQSGDSVNVIGLVDSPVNNVSLKNIDVLSKNEPNIKNGSSIALKNVSIRNLNKISKIFKISNSSNVIMDNCFCSPKASKCLEIEGEKADRIILRNSNILTQQILFMNDANKDIITFE